MAEIEGLCRKYGVEKLAVFDSVLRDDFKDASDADFLVKFIDNDAGDWGCKYTDMEADLAATFSSLSAR